MPTPHNEAAVGSIAKTVLMPGDPRRSQFIAETFLEGPELVNNVRGVHGYTGKWKGVPVTVMASGMGIPSIGIYSWELYSEYNVENIIRVGSAGALQDDLKLLDVILAQGACTTSSYIENFGIQGTFAPIADFTLLSAAKEAAKASASMFISATSSPRIISILPSTFPQSRISSGIRWVFSVLKWKLPVCMPMQPTSANAHSASAPCPIIFIALNCFLRKSVSSASPK